MSTTAITTQTKPSALALMASRFSVDPAKLLSTLKSTVFKNATDDELLALVVVSNEYGLNPLTKEIYAFPAKGGGIVPVVSIDGWINRMNANSQFDGLEFEDVFGKDGKPISTTATIWRKDRSRPVKVTEYYAECKRNTEPWNTMPSRMLRHKALCQCVRVAFGFSGVYDEDEARDVAMRDVTPMAEPAKPKFLNKPKAEPEPEVLPETTAGDAAQEAAPSFTDDGTDAVQNVPPSDLARVKLDATDITEEEFMAYMVKRRLAKPEQTWSDLAEGKFATLLKEWDAFLGAVRPQKEGQAA